MANRRMEFFIGMMVIGIVAGVFVMTILFGSEKGFFVGGGGKRLTIVLKKRAALRKIRSFSKTASKSGASIRSTWSTTATRPR